MNMGSILPRRRARGESDEFTALAKAKVSNGCNVRTSADGKTLSALGSPASHPVGEQVDPNVDRPSPGRKLPTAKEIAAAKAARIRLGFENADPLAPVEPQRVNLPEGPEPDAVLAIDYIPAAQVQPLSEPCEAAQNLRQALKASNWIAACQALAVTQQLALHHAELLRPLLPDIVPLVLNHIRSLRSQLTKIAILCIGDVCAVYKDALLPHLDGPGISKPTHSVVCQLLVKAVSNEKRFVTEAASSTLFVLVSTMDPTGVLRLLIPYTEHKNPKIRGVSAELVVEALRRFRASVDDAAEVLDFCKGSLLARCAALMSDNTPQARQAARTCACLLKTCVCECTKAPVPSGENGEARHAPLCDATQQANVDCNVQGAANSLWEAFCKGNLSTTHAHVLMKM